jgi:hypothetical protein
MIMTPWWSILVAVALGIVIGALIVLSLIGGER